MKKVINKPQFPLLPWELGIRPKTLEDIKDGVGAMVLVDQKRGLHKVMEYNEDTEMYKVHNGYKSQWVDWDTIDWDGPIQKNLLSKSRR